MKRILNTLIIIGCVLLLTACNNQREYKVIELTGEELVENVFNEDKKNIIFALYNSQLENHTNFLNDIENVSKNAKLDIYIVDISHVDNSSAAMLFSVNEFYSEENQYFAYINGNLVVSNEYKDFKTLYSDLKSLGYKSEIEIIEESVKKEYFEKAKKLYDDGKIAESLSNLNRAWSLEDAKNFYKSHSYYKVLESWERYEYPNSKTHKLNYISIDFLSSTSILYKGEEKNKDSENFTKPSIQSDYESFYYYIKDDIIYTSSSETGNYKETYKIINITENVLTLYEYKTKKENDYTLRS